MDLNGLDLNGLDSTSNETTDHVLDGDEISSASLNIPDSLSRGAIIADLRPFEDYLPDHIHGSLHFTFENGPGFAVRVRDLWPPGAQMIISSEGLAVDVIVSATASMRARSIDVIGAGALDGLKRVQTEDLNVDEASADWVLLDVGDPGAKLTQSWATISAPDGDLTGVSIDVTRPVGVIAGFGVRAASAIGVLERLGCSRVGFVRTRARGDKPISAGPEEHLFRTA